MKRKIKVAIPTIYTPDCPTIRSRLYPLCNILTERGFEFTFFTLDKGDQETGKGIIYKGYSSYIELIKFISALKKDDFDIILSCKPYSITGVLPYLIAKLKRIGYILDVDDKIFPSEINKWWRLPLYFQEWIAERLMMMLKPPTIVASKGLENYWGKHVVYIPNSADLDNFSKKNCSYNIIKEKYNLKGFVVLWPAVFFQETDRNYIFEIFKQLKDKNADILLLILGNGEYFPYMKNKAYEMGLSNVFFAGAVDYRDMPLYYASADAGIIPLRNNHYDSCKGPIKLYEYMAMELPVIATRIGEPKEMIEKADSGVLLPFDDADKAVEIIINLFSSKENLIKLGKNGRIYLENHQSLKKHADMLEKILLSTIN